MCSCLNLLTAFQVFQGGWPKIESFHGDAFYLYSSNFYLWGNNKGPVTKIHLAFTQNKGIPLLLIFFSAILLICKSSSGSDSSLYWRIKKDQLGGRRETIRWEANVFSMTISWLDWFINLHANLLQLCSPRIGNTARGLILHFSTETTVSKRMVEGKKVSLKRIKPQHGTLIYCVKISSFNLWLRTACCKNKNMWCEKLLL